MERYGRSLYDRMVREERDKYGRQRDAYDYYVQFEEERRRDRRRQLHMRGLQISQRLVDLTAVLRVLADDDLELDFAGADVPGLSLERVRADARCEEAALQRELDELTRDPDYQAA